MELRFLYVGTADTERDVATWLALPGAELRWRFQHFGADVAAVDLGNPPVVLLADHRPPGSVLPIYRVDDLDLVRAELVGQGWSLKLGPIGTPEGPACVLQDAGGTEVALLQVDRPGTMDSAYSDPANSHAVPPPD
ncbi:MAG: hypothetical protein M3N98_01115 [Actinomycetota bacterium]|nr:hypothetical protein [Actinomycetota bacterium]